MPTRTRQLPASDDPLRYVVREADRCPACRSVRLRAYRTTRQGDGSVCRHTACRTCGHRFLLVIEGAEE